MLSMLALQSIQWQESNPASKLVRKAAETVTNQQGDFYSGIKNIFFSSADCM